MKLSELFLNRFLYRDNTQNLETKDSAFVSADSTPAASSPIASGGAAQDINTGNVTINGGQLTPGTYPVTILDVSNWGWGQTCAFSSTDADTVTWGAGTFTSADGTSYSISAGNTGNMSAKTYIYLSLLNSTTVYQTTTTSANSVGLGKVLVAVAQNGATSATYMMSEATQIVGDNIIANTIDASKITTGQLIVGTNVGQGTARQNFVTTPTTPYYVGDLWSGGSTGDLKKCITQRLTGAYQAGDWDLASKYTDNTVANQAIIDAANSQATADGQLVGFYQNTAPVIGIYYGDIWIDTNGAVPLDSTCIYRYQDSSGGYTAGAMNWVNTPTNSIGLAYLRAYSAQTTADGKIVTFYQNDAPTAKAVGDLWVDLNDSNKLYRWSGSVWDSVRDSGIAQALSDASTAQSAANTAQTTADLKIESFYQASAPHPDYTNVPDNPTYNNYVGDMWYDTTANVTYLYTKTANGGNFDYKFTATTIPNTVFDVIDGKNTIFTAQPTVPYYIGDMWLTSLTGGSGDLKKCITSRTTGSYTASEWVIATDYDNTQAQLTAGADISNAKANGQTLIVGGYISTNILTADNITTGTLTGITITGCTVQTATGTVRRVVLGGTTTGEFNVYDNSNNNIVKFTSASAITGKITQFSDYQALQISNDSNLTLTSNLFEVSVNKAASTATAALFSHAGSGENIQITCTASAIPLRISPYEATGILIEPTAAGYSAILIDSSESSESGAIKIDVQTNAVATNIGMTFHMHNDDDQTKNVVFNFMGNEVDATKTTSVTNQAGVIRIMIAGVVKYIPYYTNCA
jgi:hypothetical protein